MSGPVVSETITALGGHIDVALVRVTGWRGAAWFEVRVRDHRPFGFNTAVGQWITIRTRDREEPARLAYADWLLREIDWASRVTGHGGSPSISGPVTEGHMVTGDRSAEGVHGCADRSRRVNR